jgi:hypothetical protein
VDVQLSPAGTTDHVTLTATQVETTNNTLGGTISAREVEDLLVNGRDFTKLLVLVPGATGFKTMPFTEQVKLQLRAEIFNLFNHPNFSSPLLPGFSVDASFNGIDLVTGRGIGFLPPQRDAGCRDRQPVPRRLS